MFVGFIAVIVVLLIIVVVMSTGTTSGSGGVDQTKAAKMVTEVSSLAQTAGFYKTTSPDNDYAGVSVTNLVNAGIVAIEDTTIVPDNDGDTVGDYVDDSAVGADVNSIVIVSKAVTGLYYTVAPSATSTNYIKISSLVDPASVSGTLAAALEQSYAKFGTGQDDGTTVTEGAIPSVTDNGAADLIFK